jgi:hypothetical protein
VTWARHGECCRCGDCCRGPVGNLPAQPDGACPYLETEVDGERLCAIHDIQGTYWSKGCNVWPTVPWHTAHLPRCTFTYTWVEE